MADAPTTPMVTVNAPEGYTPEAGKPISFQLPASSFDLRQFAPKDIADKEYFKKIATTDDLFKAFDGAQALIGQKPKFGVPGADATDEDWASFFKAAAGENEEAYKFEEAKDVPAELKTTPEFQKAVKQMFMAAGIHPKQAAMLQKGYDALMMGAYKETSTKNKTAQDEIDKKFVELTKSFAGEGDEWNKSMARSKQVLEYLLPKELHAFIPKANNEALTLMAALTKTVEKKYMKEDELPAGGGSGGAGSTVAELRKQAMDKQEAAMKLDNMDPKKKQLMDEATELYNRIAKM